MNLTNQFEKLNNCLTKHGINPDKIICGAYCGDGWIPLIDELIFNLISLGWNKNLDQIKEKFGTMRFNTGDYDEMTDEQIQAVENAINEAEKKSSGICECCGEPGKLIKKGWLQTLCSDCCEK